MTLQKYNALSDQLSDTQYLSVEMRDALPVILVRHTDFSADLAIQGAQLLRFAVQSEEWLWLSETAEYKTGTSLRGGIPICWPWFGDAAKNPSSVTAHIIGDNSPAHGFARSQDWSLTSVAESDSDIALSLSLENPAHPAWNGEASLLLEITMSASALTLALTTTAGQKEVTVSQALHTYFPTTDIKQTSIAGLEDESYVDAIDGWTTKPQTGPVAFTEETDRIYTVTGDLTLKSPGSTMTLSGNNRTAIVWNPWIDKAARLSQFENDAWKRMFCVESADVMDAAVSLQPGESHTLRMTLVNRSI
ncbi:D-hexose-6-phosphate mutarotase [Thalassolituus sp.]|uniref:D-hexose-6-phosphate mutarotase n=1 Tax=Thalassolituus sp. TaxID=2030822 RepID=UPI00243C5FBC|nr:D-hexose-6-phosphate mutarotase [Thalassolituus sp.]